MCALSFLSRKTMRTTMYHLHVGSIGDSAEWIYCILNYVVVVTHHCVQKVFINVHVHSIVCIYVS